MPKYPVKIYDLRRAVADLAFKAFNHGEAIGSASGTDVAADFAKVTSYKLVSNQGGELCIEVTVRGDLRPYRFSIKVSGARR